MQENRNTFIYITIKANNWLRVYHLPTNTEKMLGVLSKNAIVMSLVVRLPRYPIFGQFMRNAF